MARVYIFSDEAGDFEFNRRQNVSRHFYLCTVIMSSCGIGDDLMALRRDMAWRRLPVGDYFHCTTDKQAVRDEVFDMISRSKFTVQFTIMEKAKALPQVRRSKARFYQYGWLYHFRHGVPAQISGAREVLVTAAAIGNKKEKLSYSNAARDVLNQTVSARNLIDFRPCGADPCLQVADYCAWAAQRKWERSDSRAFDKISSHVTYEYDLWQRGTKYYY